MDSLCWIYRTAPPEERKQELDDWARGLFNVSWLEAPAGAALTPEWLSERLAAHPPTALLSCDACGFAPDELVKLSRALKGTLSQITVLWCHEKATSELRARLLESGVDGSLSFGQEAEEARLQLLLQLKVGKERAALDQKFKDQADATAKSETTLKQREEFLSVCAHDLRSPLGLIQSSISMVLGSGKSSPAIAPYHFELLTRAKRQAGHAITLVNDLLDVMAYEQGLKPHYHLLKLHDLLTDFYSDYRFQAEQKGIRFHYENAVKEWRVLADGERIRQLFQNLFVNALKFTDKDKNIYLTVMSFQGRRRADPPYPMIVISLRDEGKGIPPDELQKIFDRFTQIKDYSRSEGRGLGLTVARQISTLHDGNIWVQSVQGQGSTFFVLFPHVVSRTTGGAPPRSRKLALIAEPTLAKREEFYRQMESWGYELLFARDGVEVITLTYHALPDLIFLTSGLAKMGETDVTTTLKGDPLTANIPVYLALEEGQPPRGKHEVQLYDKLVKLPFQEDFAENKKAA